MENDELEDFKQRVRKELSNQLSGKVVTGSQLIESRQYEEFKQVYADPKHGMYERWCNIAGKYLNVSNPKIEEKVKKDIKTCHISTTPTGVTSLAMLVPMLIVFASLVFGYIIPVALDSEFSNFFFVIIGIFAALAFYPILIRIPEFLASQWRMAASNQMVLCIFYVVTYMRHTSNLELAIDFAAEHLTPPLALDLKKVIWDVETGEYESVKQSLDAYLDTWKDTNMEFVESMHLIESSLYETAEDRRVGALEKALDVILSETYEKMLHYAQNLKSPLNMLNMLGIVLPVLGLVILPLAVAFLENVRWFHIAMIYNFIFPVTIIYLSKTILSQRPTGYGQTDISKYDKVIKKQANIIIRIGKSEILINPLFQSVLLGVVLVLIGLSPLLVHTLNPEFDYNVAITNDISFPLLDYRQDGDDATKFIGPFSLFSSFISFCIPLGIGLGIGTYYRLRTKNILKIRNASKKLELEFASAIFQLGNRIGDGLPLEIAFSKVADVMKGTISGEFFEYVSSNITRLGMGVEEAIFDPQHGALRQYPSALIESSMKVLIESAKKGPLIASQSLVNISEYVRQMHRVDERLKDLMADTISSMKSQVSFLAPVIAGIVIGITSMITSILINLSEQMKNFQDIGTEGAPALPDLFGMGIPTYFFQPIVGIYIVQVVFILTYLINGIENGNDELNDKYMKGKNLVRSIILYTVLGCIVMVLFNYIAQAAMGSLPTA